MTTTAEWTTVYLGTKDNPTNYRVEYMDGCAMVKWDMIRSAFYRSCDGLWVGDALSKRVMASVEHLVSGQYKTNWQV